MSFPLYLDEQVDVELATLLRRSDHDVLTTVEAGRANKSVSDEEQLAFATSAGRAILTHNVRDFEPLGRIWSRQGRPHAGIIVSELRPARELYEGLRLLFEWYPDGIGDFVLRLPRPG